MPPASHAVATKAFMMRWLLENCFWRVDSEPAVGAGFAAIVICREPSFRGRFTKSIFGSGFFVKSCFRTCDGPENQDWIVIEVDYPEAACGNVGIDSAASCARICGG
jgi:hypothetical protein